DDLAGSALQYALELAGTETGPRVLSHRTFSADEAQRIFAKQHLEQLPPPDRGGHARRHAVEATIQAGQLPFQEALEEERRRFLLCRDTDESKALRASQSVCAEPRCSSLEIGKSDSGLVLVDLNLYADGVSSVSTGGMELEIDGLALRLYGAIQAHPYQGNHADAYVIDAGAARFLVTGSIGDMSGTRWAENQGPIR